MEFIPDFKTEFQFHDPSEIKKTFIIYFFQVYLMNRKLRRTVFILNINLL